MPIDDCSFVDLLRKLNDRYLERACPLNPTHSSSPSVQALQAGDSRRFTDGQQHERSHEAQSGLTRQQRGGRGQGRLDRGGRGSGNQRDGSFSAYSEPHAVTSDTFPAGFASNPRSGGRYSQDTARPDGRTGPPSPPRGRSNAASFDDRRRLHYETRDGQPVCHQFLLKGQCSFGNQCRYAHARRDIFQIEKRPFDGLDMVPEFSGRRSSHDQDRHTSDHRANFQGSPQHYHDNTGGQVRRRAESPNDNYRRTDPHQRVRFRERQDLDAHLRDEKRILSQQGFPSRPFGSTPSTIPPVPVSRVLIMPRLNDNLQSTLTMTEHFLSLRRGLVGAMATRSTSLRPNLLQNGRVIAMGALVMARNFLNHCTKTNHFNSELAYATEFYGQRFIFASSWQ